MLVVTMVLGFLIFCGGAFARKIGTPIAPSAVKGQNKQPVCLNLLQGTLLYTGRPWDLAIEGPGYIVLNDGQQDLYSRGRSFAVNASCYLVDPSTNYRVQRIGSVGQADGFQIPGDDNIYIPYDIPAPASPTSNIKVVGNLSADEAFPTAQTNVMKSNIVFTTNRSISRFTHNVIASGSTKLDELRQYTANGGMLSGVITVSGYNHDGMILTGGMGDLNLTVDTNTDMDNLVTHINMVLSDAANANADGSVGTASLDNGRIVITDGSRGYSRSDINLTYTPAGNETLEMPGYFEITTVGGDQVENFIIIIYDSKGDAYVLSAAFVRTDTPNIWDMVLISIGSCSPFKLNPPVLEPTPIPPLTVQAVKVTTQLEPLRRSQPLPVDLNSIRSRTLLSSGQDLIVPKLPLTLLPGLNHAPITSFDDRRIEGIEFSGLNGSYTGTSDNTEFVITFKHDISNPQVIAIDMGTEGCLDGLYQFASPSFIVTIEQDGYPSGDLSRISVKHDGTIAGSFSNGVKRDIATIQMAMFDNVCGLENIGNGYFVDSDDSGEAIITQAVSNGAGNFHTGCLEEPVELSTIIRNAIDKKNQALERIDASLKKESTAYDVLSTMLDSGDFDYLNKRDIIKARQKLYLAIRIDDLSKKVLHISNKNLEQALRTLGVEPNGIIPLQTIIQDIGRINAVLGRMQQLAQMSAEGSYSSAQRSIMNAEFQELLNEIDRIAENAEYNGIKMLNNASGTVIVNIGSTSFEFATVNITATGLGLDDSIISTISQAQTALALVSEAVNLLTTANETFEAYLSLLQNPQPSVTY